MRIFSPYQTRVAAFVAVSYSWQDNGVIMTPRQSIHLGEVQESLLVPLYGRALDSLKRHPILNDRKAQEMVQSIDWDFSRFNQAARVVACTVRTAIFDEAVKAFLSSHPAGTVVEIGSGLNTRFERLDNGTVHWFDLDLPDSIALRRKFFADTERRVALTGSVVDTDWMAAVRQSPGPYFFVAEAVLFYLQESDVKTALTQIASTFPGATIAFDTTTPRGVTHANKDHARLHLDARFQWGCQDPHEIERWNIGLRLVETRSMLEPPDTVRSRIPFRVRAVTGILLKLVPQLKEACRINIFTSEP